MSLPVVIILAAGKGQRFYASGGKTHKLDAPLAGKTVLEHVIDAVRQAGLPSQLVRPDGGTGGMGESIALGVAATPDAAGWLILPGDLPLITPETLQRVASAVQPSSVVVPCYHQQPGHPVAFGRRYYSALHALNGEPGAKAVVQRARASGNVTTLAVNDAGSVRDIDTVSDLARAQQFFTR
nr:nucleotidyltransferase family protein [uncultured Enterobacter sp.]